MTPHTIHDLRDIAVTHRLARHILFAFLVTFVAARILVIFAAEGWFPDLHMSYGDTHVHHLAAGILLLAGVGAALLLLRPIDVGLRAAALLYGVGMALTFDEFAMWLRLENVYWQRASFDAVVVIAAFFGLIAAGPSLKHLRPRHWTAAVGLGVAITLLLFLVLVPLWSAGRNFGARWR
jgi:hypothetical protein